MPSDLLFLLVHIMLLYNLKVANNRCIGIKTGQERLRIGFLGIPRFGGDSVTQKIAAPTKIQIGPTNFKNMQKKTCNTHSLKIHFFDLRPPTIV